jgi:hypothetical protein
LTAKAAAGTDDEKQLPKVAAARTCKYLFRDLPLMGCPVSRRAFVTGLVVSYLPINVGGHPCLRIQGEAAYGVDNYVQRPAHLDTARPAPLSFRWVHPTGVREQYIMKGAIADDARAELGQSLCLTTKQYFKPALAPLSCAATGPSNTGCSGLKSDRSDRPGLMYSLGGSASRCGGREQYVLLSGSEAYFSSSSGGVVASLYLVRVLCCVVVSLMTATVLHLVSRGRLGE